MYPSTKAKYPKDARYGNGQYFTDIKPGEKSTWWNCRRASSIPPTKDRNFRIMLGSTWTACMLRNQRTRSVRMCTWSRTRTTSTSKSESLKQREESLAPEETLDPI